MPSSATGMLYPEGEKGGRGKLSQIRDGLDKTERNILAQARTVLKTLPMDAKGHAHRLTVSRPPQSLLPTPPMRPPHVNCAAMNCRPR